MCVCVCMCVRRSGIDWSCKGETESHIVLDPEKPEERVGRPLYVRGKTEQSHVP